jgi:hypothetical protein
VARTPTTEDPLTVGDLSRWKLVEDFQARLKKEAAGCSLHPTWSDPKRLFGYVDYLSLFLFGLLNPAIRTMRGICEVSHIEKVLEEICSRPVSLGSFSEAQALLDIQLLSKVFTTLSQEVIAKDGQNGPKKRDWIIQDGSLFEALPRMYWAFWRKQGKAQTQVRMHLGLDLNANCPARVVIGPGKSCERAAMRTQLESGQSRMGDRYYGEDYQLLKEMDDQNIGFLTRLRDEAVIEVDEELALSPADLAQGVIRDAWVRLGGKNYRQDHRLRVVWVQTPKEVLRLVTNIKPQELSAGEVALAYKERWKIELFFRWIKCILGCRHWLAESSEGAAIELYLALIAALLLQLYTGQRPNKRMMELIQLYLLGVATLEELLAGIQRQRARVAAQKKS